LCFRIRAGISRVVTTDNVNSLQASYGAALAIAVNYRRLCESKVINKSCWKVISIIQPYDNNAYNALVELRIFTKENPNLDNTSFIQLAKSAITAFKNVQVKNGVK